MQQRGKKVGRAGQAPTSAEGGAGLGEARSESVMGGPTGPLERVYDAQILPLIDRIRALCAEHQIDHLMYFALDEQGERFLAAGSAYIEREGLDHMRIAESILRHGIDLVDAADEHLPLPWAEA